MDRRFVLLVALGMGSGVAAAARAQGLANGVQLADRGPAFFSVEIPGAVRVDARDAAVFRRFVALDLTNAQIPDALRAIERSAGVTVISSYELIPADARVTVRAERLSLAAALTAVLQDVPVDVQLSANGTLTLVRRGGVVVVPVRRMRQAVGRIEGRVTDAVTHAPLDQVSVRVEGGAAGAVTSGDGRYAIRGVVPGSYRLIARRVGYALLTKTVTVAADSTTSADFALVATPATLNEIVTTGAGQQRRVELGNAIAVINADSVRKLAPVTDITDFLSGRAPGVQVLASSGLVGDGPAIRIRGRSSIAASNDPIVFVDGVRIDAAPSGIADIFGGNNPTPSRLNDLSPDAIESIEILRGPSASTEYGTDAANGVIVIKTKHGQAGPPRWDFGTEQGLSTMPVTFPLAYHSWGHTTDGTNTSTACPFVNPFGPSRYTNTCALDSITAWQPLNHSQTSLFGTGNRHVYDLQFSEGTERVRYFASGAFTDARGVLQMPLTEQLREQRELNSALPRDAVHPNAEQQVNLRGQATGTIGSHADVSASTAYLATTQRAPDLNNVLTGALASGRGYRDSLSGYGGPFYPGGYLLNRVSESLSRFVGGLSTTWHPAGWLSLRGTAGVDNAGRTDEGLLLPNQVQGLFALFEPGGYRSTGNYRTGVYTADVGAVATASLTSQVGSKTAAGVQYYDTRNRGTAVAVTNLGIGNPTLNGGAIYGGNSIQERKDEALTLGTYLDETISLAERLYLTGAVRLDAGSGFGKQYNSALYPKASLSWVISPEPSNLLRLRAAYGQSGVQPSPGAALRLYAPFQGYVNGVAVAADTVSAYGNGRLRPERSSEIETGADIGFLRNRFTLELTGYVKTTTDAIVTVPIEASLGGGSLAENLGEVRNRGLEASLTGHPIDGRVLAWDFTLSGSVNDNKLVTLGPGVLPIDQSAQYANPYRQEPGYPLYGYWASPVTYQDLNHDGLIEPNEVTVGDSVTFQGSSIPLRELSLNTGVSLLNHRVRISTQIDHRGGQKLSNAFAFLDDVFANARDLNSPQGVPQWEQAHAVATATIGVRSFRGNALDIEDASFTRWREFSVAYLVPERLAAAVRARNASVTLAVRNLALWTHFTGGDPEVNNVGVPIVLAGQTTTAVNHDIVGDYGGMPQTRSWVLKVSLGL